MVILLLVEKSPGDANLENLCRQLLKMTALPVEELQQWVRYLVFGPPQPPPGSTHPESSSASSEPAIAVANTPTEPTEESSTSAQVILRRKFKIGIFC